MYRCLTDRIITKTLARVPDVISSFYFNIKWFQQNFFARKRRRWQNGLKNIFLDNSPPMISSPLDKDKLWLPSRVRNRSRIKSLPIRCTRVKPTTIANKHNNWLTNSYVHWKLIVFYFNGHGWLFRPYTQGTGFRVFSAWKHGQRYPVFFQMLIIFFTETQPSTNREWTKTYQFCPILL